MTLKYDKYTKRNRSEYVRIAKELIISHSELQTCLQCLTRGRGGALLTDAPYCPQNPDLDQSRTVFQPIRGL